jgi:hypothetical protein
MFSLSNDASSKPSFIIYDGTASSTAIVAPNVLNVGVWYHLAVSYNSTDNKVIIYVNGDSVVAGISTKNISQVIGTRTQSYLGYSAWGDRSDVLMDEVRFWDVALSSTTINTNKDKMFSTAHPLASHLLARYTFEGNANNMNGSATYNGVLNNANTNVTTTAPYNWTWLPSGTATTNTITQSPTNTTTYNLVYTASNGCTVSKNYTINIGKLFVDSSKILGLNNGSSWDNAFTRLDSALKPRACLNEIWVANGTYKPTNGTNRDSSFVIPNGVKVYGGFAGGEINLGDRNIITNHTILSGDIGLQNNSADNSYHVVSIRNVNTNTLLDGFTITSGQGASGSNLYGNNGDGAGLYINYPNSGLTASPTIANCIIEDNNGNYGVGAFVEGRGLNTISKPVFNDCIFRKDTANNNGGAVGYYGADDNDTAVFNKCLFVRNKATNGGGIMVDGNAQLTITNCVLDSNRADNQGAGVYTVFGNKNIIANSVFTNGFTINGGSAILSSTNSFTKIINCTMFGNKQGVNNSAVYNYNCNTDIKNTIIQGSNGNAGSSIFNSGTVTESVTYSNIQLATGVYTGLGNINKSPLFKDSLNLKGADENWFTNDDGLTLKSTSLLLNAGSNAAIPVGITTDIANNNRINFSTVDIGAYEFNIANCTGINTWIGVVSTDWNNAANWTCNIPTATDEVVIKSAAPFMPIVNANASIKKITVQAGASVIVATGKTLTLLGN